MKREIDFLKQRLGKSSNWTLRPLLLTPSASNWLDCVFIAFHPVPCFHKGRWCNYGDTFSI